MPFAAETAPTVPVANNSRHRFFVSQFLIRAGVEDCRRAKLFAAEAAPTPVERKVGAASAANGAETGFPVQCKGILEDRSQCGRKQCGSGFSRE